MDQKTALQRFQHGAFLIIAGVPPKTEFGIDCSKFVVAEKFRGVKMIPPGPHFVYCASVGPFGDAAPRVGFIHYFREREIVIREWDPETEELRVRTKGDPEVEKQFIQENILQFDELLAPYDYDSLSKWQNLTTYITQETVESLSPACGVIRTCADLLSCSDDDRPRGGGTCGQAASPKSTKINLLFDEDHLLPQLKPIPGTVPNFTELPPRFMKEATPSEITNSFMDSIVALDKLIECFSSQTTLLSEVQFAFALFVAGCSTDGLAHWRKILAIASNTEKGVQKYRNFYRRFLLCVQYQLPHLPLEVMQPSPENSVYQDVRKLVANCILGNIQGDVENFKNYLSETMLWTFEDVFEDDPEDLPVVVECP
ncbi:protein AAR2 homolog [Phlebotomus argentipes]|uniref:protein AAR2 homolog n=1 Tax=Phlebotomus argentipes TaxID=94469 RepID=UPI002892CD18|nr:protein AAR2 homolog [Phlebotomus argentipes]